MTIAPAGEYDLSNAGDLERALRSAAEADELCLDLAAVEFLDCVALSVILRAVSDADERGVPVHIRNPRPVVRRMLELSGLATRAD